MPSLSCLSSKNTLHASLGSPRPPLLLALSPFLLLPHFTKLPNEGTCHLYTSSVSCFPIPSSPPSLPLALPHLPRSQSTVTGLPLPLDAAGLTASEEAQKAQRDLLALSPR